MGIHRHVLWDVEPSDAPKITAVTWDRASDIIGELYTRLEGRASVRLSIHVPDPVDTHGEHEVAHRTTYDAVPVVRSIGGVPNLVLDVVGTTTVCEPEKRPATCACCMGAGAQPYAHEPSCPVHPRYVDTGLSDDDRTCAGIRGPYMDDAKSNGEEAELEAEYARAFALVKAGAADDGAISRLRELAKSLGYPPSHVYFNVPSE